MESKAWHRARLWWHVVIAAAVLGAAVLHGFGEFHLLRHVGWLHAGSTQFWGVTGVALVVFVDSSIRARHEYKRPAAEVARVRVRKPALGALITVAAMTKWNECDGEEGLCFQRRLQDLGANVFIAGRRRLWRQPRLRRLERIRLTDYPQPSSVHFSQGKGVVGLCWRNARPEHVDWSPIARRWGSSDLSGDEWAKIPEEDKYGFTRDEFVAMAGKYAEILAVPVTEPDGTLLGCLAVDRVYDPTQDDATVLNDHGVIRAVTVAASSIADVIANS